MAMWPFGRRYRRAARDEPQPAPSHPKAGKPLGLPSNSPDTPVASRPVRRSSKRNNGARARPSSRHALHEKVTVPGSIAPPSSPVPGQKPQRLPVTQSREDITALPFSRQLGTSPHLRPATRGSADIPYNFRLPSSHSNIVPPQNGKLQRNPSRNKRAAIDPALPRRKSTKKRKDDVLREEEIRAMSAPIPIPKSHRSSDLLRRDSKKMRNGLNKYFERPLSSISLPLAESIHSSLSGQSEARNYRVSLLDVVIARPTLRYSLNTPYVSAGVGQNRSTGPSRTNSRREKRPIPNKEVMKGNRTIDRLADDLDASELREIMERDQRRREQRKLKDAEKLKRKLERKAEKQRRKGLEERAQASAGNALDPHAKEIEASEYVGLGIHSDSCRQAEREAAAPDKPHVTKPSEVDHSNRYGYSLHKEISQLPPFDTHDEPESLLETPFDLHLDDDPATIGASPATRVAEELSSPTSPLRMDRPEETISTIGTETLSQPSSSLPRSYNSFEPTPSSSVSRRESYPKRGMFSLFRRDASRRKSSTGTGKATPSSETSFKNITRDHVTQQSPAAQPYQGPSRSLSRSGGALRTQSRFREELPETYTTLPQSRVQSPEAVFGGASPSGLGSNVMSQSLASIDSEASWFSGKPLNKMSPKSRVRHQSGTSSAGRSPEDFSAEQELHDDEYFRRLAAQAADLRRPSAASNAFERRASSNAIVSERGAATDEDEDPQSSPVPARNEDETVMHSGPNRHPTVHHRDMRVKSSEGLLNQFTDTGQDSQMSPVSASTLDPFESPFDEGGSSPTEDPETPQPAVHRATSISLGAGHARHLSAGSAKLLDIPKRNSQQSTGDPNRLSRSMTPVEHESAKL